MSLKLKVRELARDTFPSLWLQWHLARRPKSAEVELGFLSRIVRRGDITVDVGANLGLYTRALARQSRKVHAFEPSPHMAEFLRRTSASNVAVHEMALSDRGGDAELLIPRERGELSYSLASLEPDIARSAADVTSHKVPLARLDDVVHEDVAFVKIDVEGHELSVLAGASGLFERGRPSFLVEVEDRHRPHATQSIFGFFRDRGYQGFFVRDDEVYEVGTFDTATLQDPRALLPNGARRGGHWYINNFFFLPAERDGRRIMRGG
jgi:FkbM family methyltransferase